MNAGFANLTTLKQQLLAPELQTRNDWDNLLQVIGLGVAGSFGRYCNRDFDWKIGAQEVTQGERDHWYVRRTPVSSFTKVELRYFRADPWTDISGQPLAADEHKGLIHFGYTLGRRPIQVRITYNGGYFWEQLEPSTNGYPTPVPDDITNNPAGIDPSSFNLPNDLIFAWVTQCRKVWEAADKIGSKITEVGSNTRNPSEALAGLDLVPEVKEILNSYIRYQLT